MPAVVEQPLRDRLRANVAPPKSQRRVDGRERDAQLRVDGADLMGRSAPRRAIKLAVQVDKERSGVQEDRRQHRSANL